MSDFTPNSGDSAPQGTPFVPQDGEYRTSEDEQQLPMPPHDELPRENIAKGPIVTWIAALTILALIVVFFMWRNSSTQKVQPAPTPSTSSSVPLPSASLPDWIPPHPIDDGIDEDTIEKVQSKCANASQTSGKMDLLLQIKTKPLRITDKNTAGKVKYTYTATVTGYAKGSSVQSRYEITCPVTYVEASDTFNVDGAVDLTLLPAASQSFFPTPTPTTKNRDDGIDEKTWLMITFKCSSAAAQSLRDDYQSKAVSTDYLKKTGTRDNGDEEYEVDGTVHAERKYKEDTDFSSALFHMKCTATHVKASDSYEIKAFVDPNPQQ